MIPFDVRTLPAEALLGADFRHPEIVRATALVERAEGAWSVPPSTRLPTPGC
ncbi:NAD(P)H-dependent FMN reductase [Streptomyces viridochromogenes DSM 40736]|uniref:NAD(P)H-dependent FMN reductase n=1 Tax=Streptomyces viridochromogenes (strain DSM 40736 / JCM 4977 / BCRC 1201 / Tue 494) TaxID=591159 RepID=D9X776_STRVT|nr:NAD(P)H-dependent FMN reductase [Streptomyces viridochromogenes DSM 40736]